MKPTPIDVAALDEYDIWPLENNIDISLDSLRLLSLDKLRNRYVDGEVSATGVYSVVDAGRQKTALRQGQSHAEQRGDGHGGDSQPGQGFGATAVVF